MYYVHDQHKTENFLEQIILVCQRNLTHQKYLQLQEPSLHSPTCCIVLCTRQYEVADAEIKIYAEFNLDWQLVLVSDDSDVLTDSKVSFQDKSHD